MTKEERYEKALKEIARPKVGPDFDWSEDEVAGFRATWCHKYENMARKALHRDDS